MKYWLAFKVKRKAKIFGKLWIVVKP